MMVAILTRERNTLYSKSHCYSFHSYAVNGGRQSALPLGLKIGLKRKQAFPLLIGNASTEKNDITTPLKKDLKHKHLSTLKFAFALETIC